MARDARAEARRERDYYSRPRGQMRCVRQALLDARQTGMGLQQEVPAAAQRRRGPSIAKPNREFDPPAGVLIGRLGPIVTSPASP